MKESVSNLPPRPEVPLREKLATVPIPYSIVLVERVSLEKEDVKQRAL